MKRATLEATDENVLKSIKGQNSAQRNLEIKDFISALDMIEGNMFISLDARWGEGKTFYVRQIEKALEYQTMKKFSTEDTNDELDRMKVHFTGTELEDIDLGNSYFPIYYNAWLYDNHTDPLMSLLYVVVKKCGKIINPQLTKEKSDRIKQMLQSIQVNFPFFSINGEQVVNAVSNKNIFEEIQLAEDIRNEVKLIFDEAIVEQAQKLVIFIDELDRCKPSYALEMLERIKHYFDDDRIIFIVSVNKEQLTHTISNYYGNGFDSTGYLNKFFDINVYVPPVESKKKNSYSIYGGRRFFEAMIKTFSDYYRLSLRDKLIYEERMAIIDASKSNKLIDDDTISGICASIFVPLIVILDMKDVEEKIRFINGESDILEKIEDLTDVSNIYKSLGWQAEEESRWMDGKKKVEAVYRYAFQNKGDLLKPADLSISQLERNLKEMCIKLSGVIRDDRPTEKQIN
jgi:hypothetical protein